MKTDIKLHASEYIRGYIFGMYRGENGNKLATHLYKGTFDNPGQSMCKNGYNDGFGGYSIFRGNMSRKGICKVCLKRAQANLNPIDWPNND